VLAGKRVKIENFRWNGHSLFFQCLPPERGFFGGFIFLFYFLIKKSTIARVSSPTGFFVVFRQRTSGG